MIFTLPIDIRLCRGVESSGQDCGESEKKRALSVDCDVFPASHEGRV